MRGSALVAVIVGVLCAAASAEEVERISALVRTPDAPRAARIDAFRIDGVDYLDVNDVARVFRSTKYWRAELEKMVLKLGGQRVRLTVGSPFVFVEDMGHQLVAPVRWHEGRIVVPVGLTTEVLDGLVGETVSWDRDRRTLRIDTGDPNVTSVAYDVRRNGTVAEILLTVPLSGTLQIPGHELVRVRIPGGVLERDLLGVHPGEGLLDSVVCAQDPGEASLTFHLGPTGGPAELLERDSPPRLVLAVSELTVEDIPLPEFERRTPSGDARREVRVVLLDPGHGGSDPGVTSAGATPEKDITLAVALRARERLQEDLGLEVHLTRDGDRFVSAATRAELANRLRPDVVIAIHCNGWFDESLRGFSVEIPVGGAEPAVDPEIPLWGTRTVRSRRDAETFAEILLHEMGSVLPFPNRGVRTTSDATLEGSQAPAVHLECGFLTNRTDASHLVDPQFQETIAEAVSRAVAEYRQYVARGEVGAP